MKQTGYDMLYLTACALNGIQPDAERIQKMDLDTLYKMAKFHSLTAIVAISLEKGGITLPAEWAEEKAKAIRKNMLLDAERSKICRWMEENAIWHMPLKGIILKEMYPGLGMRQMSDNDILYDAAHQKELMDYMKSQGYTPESVGKTHHDTYWKPPVFNYEMHTMLFDRRSEFYTYYADIRKKLIPDEGKQYGMHFTDEDFYVYMTAHEYKHFSNGGTGLRSLADRYVYRKAKPQLDDAYIRQEQEKLGIAEFEEKSRKLAEKVFSDPNSPLTDVQKQMLHYYLFSGTYGTVGNVVRNKMKGDSKIGYIWRRIFPDKEFYQTYYPFFYRHKLLLPAAWAFRLIRGVLFRSKKWLTELRVLGKL